MVLWGMSPPSSRFAGFPKSLLLAQQLVSWLLACCGASSTSLDSVTEPELKFVIFLIVCVNLARLWYPDVWSNTNVDVSVKEFFFKYLFICLFIYLFWLRWILVAALGIFVAAFRIFSCGMWAFFFLVVACGLLSCTTWTFSCSMHEGSSSLTRDQTWAPCIGSSESYPLDHQGSPWRNILEEINI